MKSGMQTYFFLASCGFRSKVVILVIVKRSTIRDPEKIHPWSRSRIQGIKKHRICNTACTCTTHRQRAEGRVGTTLTCRSWLTCWPWWTRPRRSWWCWGQCCVAQALPPCWPTRRIIGCVEELCVLLWCGSCYFLVLWSRIHKDPKIFGWAGSETRGCGMWIRIRNWTWILIKIIKNQ
jgi:hypothetical protein